MAFDRFDFLLLLGGLAATATGLMLLALTF
jgi:hypothetical protein